MRWRAAALERIGGKIRKLVRRESAEMRSSAACSGADNAGRTRREARQADNGSDSVLASYHSQALPSPFRKLSPKGSRYRCRSRESACRVPSRIGESDVPRVRAGRDAVPLAGVADGLHGLDHFRMLEIAGNAE